MKYFMHIYIKNKYILKIRIAERDALETHTRWKFCRTKGHACEACQRCQWISPPIYTTKLQQKMELNGQSKFGSITKPISWVQRVFINKPITVYSLPTLYGIFVHRSSSGQVSYVCILVCTIWYFDYWWQ